MSMARTDTERDDRKSQDDRTGDMVRIPGGTFRMGSERSLSRKRRRPTG